METATILPKMRYCSIQSCINFKGTTSDKFHFFKPSMEKHILEKWKEAISQHQNFKNITFVCNLHFEPESLIKMDEQLFLKHGSIPSIFGSVQVPESEIQNEEAVVKMESMSIEGPNIVQLVNINKIIQNKTTSNDELTQNNRIKEVDSEICNGCDKRDIKIKTLLVNLDKLKKAYEQKIKLVRYWKSLAVYYKRGHTNPIVVRVNKFKRQAQMIPKKRIKPVRISTELIKVEGKPHEDMDIDEASTLIEPETTKAEATTIETATVETTTIETASIEITDDDETDSKVNKPTVEVPNPLLKPYKCGKCNETFEKPKELIVHMRTMHRTPRPIKSHTFECYVCKKLFKLQIYLKKHMKLHTKASKKCVVCRVSYDEGQMDQHLCIQEESISCEHCPQTYSSTEELLDHLESAHTEMKVHKCSTCKQSFKMMFLKIIHERCHDSIKPFNCNLCTKSYTIQDSLIRHQKRDHINKEAEPETKRFLCDQCGKECASQTKLTSHLMTHRERKFKCPHCPYGSRYSDGLKRHSYLHRNDIFVCSICGAERASPVNLRRHMVVQHGSSTSSFSCDICEKRFKNKKNLHTHQKVHVTNKGFPCTFCNNSYKYRGDLNKHLKVHLGDKIYECKECSERFRLPLELQKHSFTHYKGQQMTTED